MIRVLAWAVLFLALCIVFAWALLTPFPLHVLLAIVIAAAMVVVMTYALLALAHTVSNSGGL